MTYWLIIIVIQIFSFFIFSFFAKIVKKKELTVFKHGKIIDFYEAEDSKRAISKKTEYEKTTIYNIIVKYHKTDVISVTS